MILNSYFLMKRLWLLILGMLIMTQLQAQLIKLSDEPAQFVADVQKMMTLSGNPNYIKTAKNLEALWIDSRLTPTYQKTIVTLTRRMVAKGYKPNTAHFDHFFGGLYAAYNGTFAAPETVEGYLNTATQVIEQYDPKASLKYFETARILFENRLLYTSNFNRLFALDGTFSFRFSDATSELIKTVEAAKKSANDDGWGTALDSTALQAPVFYEKKKIPDVAGAVIEFKNTNLVMVTANDSVPLTQTNGKLAVREGTWVGTGGKMTWEMTGKSGIYVTFSAYSFNVGLPKITTDDVKLHYGDKLAQPIEGAFEYESKRRAKGQMSPYPRFVSYRNDAQLKGLSKNVQYRGGVALVGTKLSGTSLSQEAGLLSVSYNGKTAFRSYSRRFELMDSVVTTQLGSFHVTLGQTDSLYHPGVVLLYNDDEGLLTCQRADRTAYKYVPYGDSYHKMFVEAEMLRWSFKKQQIEFLMIAGKTEVPVRFESYHFFKPERFRGISEQYSFHPLLMAANYISKQQTQYFAPEELATFYKRDMNAVVAAFRQMTYDGYFAVEPSNGLLKFTPKGRLYVLANTKQTDFDNFRINSLFAANNNTANASINLNDNILTIRGVEQFTISDSLKIFAFPSDKQIRMLKNRDFWMNGLLKSANFRFNGRDLLFNYDKFFVDLNKIDNITFVPKDVYDKGGSTEVGGDVVYEKSGRIYLNDPGNKSGGRKNSVFPRLTVPEGMTVYFDQADRGDLKYNRKVYFKIPSIDYDSLGMQDIVFIGTFYSDGIMPSFPAQLRSMPDNSLGFTYTPPAAGYKVYGTNTNVKFTKELVMDKKGLRSQGEITHLSARIPTQSMLFMTDSLVATGAEAEIKEATIGKAYFPKVDLRNFTLRWTPKADSMALSTKANAFNFYNATTKLEGRLILRSTGLYGKGFLRRDDSELTSQDIKFNKEGFVAGESQYKIISATNNIRPVLLGKNVDVDFNIVKGMVNITTNNTLETNSDLEFPFAAYRTSISRAQWNINAKTIAMKGDVATSTFTATAPTQEGLTFNASVGLYEIEKMILNINGVPFIKTADAKVLPEKGVVVIRKDGDMQPFKNARLVLDTLNEYHRLKNGNIQILSRTKFTGDATYLYATVTNDTIPIKMGNFDLRQEVAQTANSTRKPTQDKNKPEKVFYTVARAEVSEADNFIAAPRLQYKGALTMLAPEPNLQFNGFVKPVIKKRADLQATWIPFQEIPTKDMAFKITPTLKNESEQPISVGLHYSVGNPALYATFLSAKDNRNDQTIFAATGLMRFDDKTKSFKITPEPQKPDELIDEENAYTFNDAKGSISYSGRLNFMYSRDAKDPEAFLAAGTAQTNVDSSTYRFNSLLSFNFSANKEVIAKLSDEMVKSNLDAQNSDAAEPDWDRLGAKIAPLIGRKAADAYINRAATSPRPLSDASPKFNSTIVLSNVNLRWSPTQNAFYSVGPIGVSNIGATDINAQMEGMVEIRKNARGDEVSIYLEIDEDTWYYLDWQQGKLAMLTSIIEVNDFAMAKSKDKKDKEESILVVGAEEKDLFTDRFASLYRPKVVKKPVVAKTPPAKAAPAKGTPAKTNPSKTPAKEEITEEEEEEEAPTVAKKPTTKAEATKTPKEGTKTAAKDPKATTDKANSKVAQTPPPAKAPVKKKVKEEEKEGF